MEQLESQLGRILIPQRGGRPKKIRYNWYGVPMISWLACIGMDDRAGRPFNSLSYGEKRLVLIARAMIKSPELLILDEPCQGLDRSNREMVLALMEELGHQPAKGMIYVTHHETEMIPCIQHVLTLGREN